MGSKHNQFPTGIGIEYIRDRKDQHLLHCTMSPCQVGCACIKNLDILRLRLSLFDLKQLLLDDGNTVHCTTVRSCGVFISGVLAICLGTSYNKALPAITKVPMNIKISEGKKLSLLITWHWLKFKKMLRWMRENNEVQSNTFYKN